MARIINRPALHTHNQGASFNERHQNQIDRLVRDIIITKTPATSQTTAQSERAEGWRGGGGGGSEVGEGGGVEEGKGRGREGGGGVLVVKSECLREVMEGGGGCHPLLNPALLPLPHFRPPPYVLNHQRRQRQRRGLLEDELSSRRLAFSLAVLLFQLT